jgi:hypothetical protein
MHGNLAALQNLHFEFNTLVFVSQLRHLMDTTDGDAKSSHYSGDLTLRCAAGRLCPSVGWSETFARGSH